MSIILCMSTGDFDMSAGQMQLTDGQQETLQLIRNTLRFFLGEEQLDTSIGMPWIQVIFQKGTPPSTIQSIIYQAVLNCPGVLSVTNFTVTINPTNRTLTVAFTAQSAAGPILFSESFP